MKYRYVIILMVLISAGLPSCLKEKLGVNLSDIPFTRIIELAPNDDPSKGSADRVNTRAFGISTTPTQLQIPVYLNSPGGPYNKDVTVTLAKDPAGLAAYNVANGTTYEFLPDSVYTQTPFTVTIPAGQNFGYMTLSIKTSKVDASHSYLVAYKITSTPADAVLSDTRGASIWTFVFINQYDGQYHSVGVFHHPVSGDRPINRDKTLSTVSSNAVRTELGDLGANGYYMILTINANNSVTITPDGATPNVDQHWGPNTYDPATRTFHLNYSYNTSAPRIVQEDITHN